MNTQQIIKHQSESKAISNELEIFKSLAKIPTPEERKYETAKDREARRKAAEDIRKYNLRNLKKPTLKKMGEDFDYQTGKTTSLGKGGILISVARGTKSK